MENQIVATNAENEITEAMEEATLQVPDRLKFEIGTETENDNKETEEDSSSKMSRYFDEFNTWLLDNGAKYPELYMKQYSGDVRGVHTKSEIPPFACIVEIPVHCLITDHMGRTETEIGRKLFEGNSTLSTPNLIAVVIYILTTREDPNHFFQPYYRILPKDYSNFPIFWDDEKLEWLQGSPIVDDIIDRKRNMKSDYDEVCRICPEFSKYSFNEFLEIRTAVGSRNFGIVVHGNKRTAMVPFADMLNHFRPRETSWTFEDVKDAFTITSLSTLFTNQQVMDSYGKKCNSKFFLHYGFAVENNREEDGKCQNELYIRIAMDRTDPHVERRAQLLGHARLSRGFRLSMNIEDPSTLEAINYCRVATATEEELDQVSEKRGLGSNAARGRVRNPISFISIENEVRSLNLLASFCKTQLQEYANSFDQNIALLNSGTVGPFTDRRTALLVVLGEQEICNFWIGAAEKIEKCVAESNTENPIHLTLRMFPKNTPGESDFSRYATRIGYEIRMQQ